MMLVQAKVVRPAQDRRAQSNAEDNKAARSSPQGENGERPLRLGTQVPPQQKETGGGLNPTFQSPTGHGYNCSLEFACFGRLALLAAAPGLRKVDAPSE